MTDMKMHVTLFLSFILSKKDLCQLQQLHKHLDLLNNLEVIYRTLMVKIFQQNNCDLFLQQADKSLRAHFRSYPISEIRMLVFSPS